MSIFRFIRDQLSSIGLALTLLGSLSPMLKLTEWARYLVSNWLEICRSFWRSILFIPHIHLNDYFVCMLNCTGFLLIGGLTRTAVSVVLSFPQAYVEWQRKAATDDAVRQPMPSLRDMLRQSTENSAAGVPTVIVSIILITRAFWNFHMDTDVDGGAIAFFAFFFSPFWLFFIISTSIKL